MSSKMKIAIICDGKEISFGLNLLHLFLYKDDKVEFSCENKGEIEIELFSLSSFRHTKVSPETIKVFTNNTQSANASYSKVFDEYGMKIYKSDKTFIIRADDSRLSGVVYDEFVNFANKKAKEYLELEQSYINRVLSHNNSWITKSFDRVPSGGLFIKKKQRIQQQYDCLAYILYLNHLGCE